MHLSTPQWRMASGGSYRHLGYMLATRISENIWRIREAKGLSRTQLAQRCDPVTSSQQIERLEKGERRLTVDWIERIATALDVDPAELIAGEERQFELSPQVADMVALEFARFVTRGDEPDRETVEGLSILVQDLSATFADVPEARRDPQVMRPVLRLLTRQRGRQS
jgi:transcriptional regulator with XRE-family HTH domain